MTARQHEAAARGDQSDREGDGGGVDPGSAAAQMWRRLAVENRDGGGGGVEPGPGASRRRTTFE